MIAKRQYAILAQHLCSNNGLNPFAMSSIRVLQTLAQEYQNGNILVARTSRSLRYNVMQQYVRYFVRHEGGRAVIHVTYIDDPVFGRRAADVDDLRGVTFYTSDPKHTDIRIGNSPVGTSLIQRNPSDGIAPSIMIRWYPRDLKDHSLSH